MDDAKIIALYQSRSELAITHTSEKYGNYLNQVAYNILRCHEDTEEVVSDTYLTAWNNIPPQIPRTFKYYLSRITRNLAYNRLDYRNAGRRDPHMVLILSELDACIPDNRSDMDGILEGKQIGKIINHYLSALSREDRAIFLCRYFYCLKTTEIAEKYGLTDRHVKYRLSVLRQQLRTKLRREEIRV